MKLYFSVVLSMLLLACGCTPMNAPSGEVSDLLDRVEKLNIGRNGFILGKALTESQKEAALHHPVDIENPLLFKFRQNDLYIVAEKQTHRPVILYKQHDAADREKLRKIVGELFLEFGEPTVFTHDKVIYWAYGQEKKISEPEYQKSKDEKKNIQILATVKLTSDLKITEKNGKVNDTAKGSVYYIISSPPVLKAIASKGSDTGNK